MSIEQKFFNIATDEVGAIDNYETPAAEAAARIYGAIGMNVQGNSKEEFIAAGLRYLDIIDDCAEQKIDKLKLDADEAADVMGDTIKFEWKHKVIAAIQALVKEADRVNRAEFSAILAADWDERHEA